MLSVTLVGGPPAVRAGVATRRHTWDVPLAARARHGGRSRSPRWPSSRCPDCSSSPPPSTPAARTCAPAGGDVRVAAGVAGRPGQRPALRGRRAAPRDRADLRRGRRRTHRRHARRDRGPRRRHRTEASDRRGGAGHARGRAPSRGGARPGPELPGVHQQDIQAYVNALWAGGARAVTLQGQRLISTTGIRCVGNTGSCSTASRTRRPTSSRRSASSGACWRRSRTRPRPTSYRDYADRYEWGSTSSASLWCARRVTRARST